MNRSSPCSSPSIPLQPKSVQKKYSVPSANMTVTDIKNPSRAVRLTNRLWLTWLHPPVPWYKPATIGGEPTPPMLTGHHQLLHQTKPPIQRSSSSCFQGVLGDRSFGTASTGNGKRFNHKATITREKNLPSRRRSGDSKEDFGMVHLWYPNLVHQDKYPCNPPGFLRTTRYKASFRSSSHPGLSLWFLRSEKSWMFLQDPSRAVMQYKPAKMYPAIQKKNGLTRMRRMAENQKSSTGRDRKRKSPINVSLSWRGSWFLGANCTVAGCLKNYLSVE